MSRRKRVAARAEVPAARPGATVANRSDSGQRSWYRIVNHADTGAEIQIYDEIGYWGVTATDFVADLRQITAPELTLRINSPGGEVFDGLAIYNALLDHPATVRVVVDGIAASAASFIAQAGDRVVMNRGAQMMIHDAAGFAFGDASTMTEMAALLDKLSDQIAGIYAARGGGDVEAWRERMRAEMWLTGAEAVEVGLADEVVETPRRGATGEGEPDEEPDGGPTDRWDLSMYRYPGRDHAPAPAPVAEADEPPDPVPAAQVVIVSEARPELFVPDRDGLVLPATTDPPDEPDAVPDERADLAAQLPHPDPEPSPADNTWAALTAHLTDPASSADDEFERLKEALL